ncbi:metalloregulator ArsR/SmtB family transcription factor [Pseudonocardia nigra]|uniref:metalloregulator ArsR/SmtB family transcription factor n=1 Tax=Pseudonocardia nigra TaxID=1921578 RepID=UPI001C5E099B|nr:metalloregulator ArsR/SmtB family transcription factor [Pseudonocardia nigra]
MSRRVVPDEEPLWRALADPTRRAILDALRAGPRTTGALAESFPTTRYTVMEHLDVLVRVGLVTVERRGRQRLNHLNPVPLQQVQERWVRPLAAVAADTLLRMGEAAGPGRSAMTSTAYGIDVRAEHHVGADPAAAWRALLALPEWWPRRWSAEERLVFEPRVGGRLGPVATGGGVGPGGEPFGAGAGGELWGTITALRPHRQLVVDGAMGLRGPVLGQWRITLEAADDDGTTVALEHRVLGPVDEDDRDCFAAGWTETLASLAAYAERRS